LRYARASDRAGDRTEAFIREVSNGHSVHGYKILISLSFVPSPPLSVSLCLSLSVVFFRPYPSPVYIAEINESPIAITRDKLSVYRATVAVTRSGRLDGESSLCAHFVLRGGN